VEWDNFVLYAIVRDYLEFFCAGNNDYDSVHVALMVEFHVGERVEFIGV
jgi:hypothetical protein